jgi:acetyltransferase-like isoleucine patch superfamily enzyme
MMAVLTTWAAGAIARCKLRRCTRVGAAPRVFGHIWIHGRGRIFLGDRVTLDASQAPIELNVPDPDSEIHIGDDVMIEGGSSIEAVLCVRLGTHCHLGPFTKVLDNHQHPLRGDRSRRNESSISVEIEEDVQVEARSIILPGARLGRGVRVRADSVVSRRVPAGLVVAGMPATSVGEPATTKLDRLHPADMRAARPLEFALATAAPPHGTARYGAAP